jgi:hypothetical protein
MAMSRASRVPTPTASTRCAIALASVVAAVAPAFADADAGPAGTSQESLAIQAGHDHARAVPSMSNAVHHDRLVPATDAETLHPTLATKAPDDLPHHPHGVPFAGLLMAVGSGAFAAWLLTRIGRPPTCDRDASARANRRDRQAAGDAGTDTTPRRG